MKSDKQLAQWLEDRSIAKSKKLQELQTAFEKGRDWPQEEEAKKNL